jgi:nitroimidazol reductase NimA-like FMN-containing flavoprotein (pyridoxamine 5'-phosphate oxidase superfamily)
MSIVMTIVEREAFLAGVHVGVFCVQAEDRGPLAVPIWYDYEPGGEVKFCTFRGSRKVRLLEKYRRFTLLVQNETRPYKFVSVEGPVIAIESCDLDKDLGPIARRYLGEEGGKQYIEEARSVDETLIVRMQPENWSTADYSKE